MTNLTRRKFLKAASMGACCAASSSFFPKLFVHDAWAQAMPTKKLVVVELSGGMDYPLFLERTGNAAYMDAMRIARPTLGIPVAARLPLGSSEYTVHNRLAVLQSMFDAGEAAFIRGVGIVRNSSGSHEEATFDFETGVNDGRSMEKAGMLQRLGQQYFSGGSVFQCLDMQGGSDIVKGGAFRALSLRNLSNYGFNGTVNGESGFRLATGFAAVAQAGVNPDELALQRTWSDVQVAVTQVAQAVAQTTLNPAFPNTSIGRQLRDVFIGMTSLGVSAAFVSTGGYDLHGDADPTGQAVGTPTGISRLYLELNDALAAFRANMIRTGMWPNVIGCTISEFGRTARENSNRGLDHGAGNGSVVFGGTVNGGLYGADTDPTEFTRSRNSFIISTPIVDVYWRAIEGMGLNPAPIFPGHVPTLPALVHA